MPCNYFDNTLTMNFAKSAACLLGALSFPFGSAYGQFLELDFRDEKFFRITGVNQFEYLGGEWYVDVQDGIFIVLPCFANFGEAYQVPIQLPPCPAGTTGLITQGDIDGDGIRETGLYVSIEQPIPTSSIQPFAPERIELDSAPPSQLPRPVAAFNWSDQSARIFYDLIADPRNGTGYNISFYVSQRFYQPDELERHRDEIVPGVYRFRFPALGSTDEQPRDFFMSIAHREMVEAAPGPGGRSVTSEGIFVGNDFLLDDPRWNNGAIEIDPRLGFDFEWEGFNQSTFLGDDRITFAIRERATGLVRFPPVPDPAANPDTRQLIGSSELGIPTGIDIGSGFFAPDEELVAELEFRRNLVSGSSVDRSVRFFFWDIDLIDSYPGFITENFPIGTPAVLRAPDFDYDDDGYTNLEEFGFQTDPLDPASVPNPTPTLNPLTGRCFLEVPKRPAIGASLTYSVQYSADLENWTTITPNDPNWFILFDNEERIAVLSKRSSEQFPCFVRVRFSQN